MLAFTSRSIENNVFEIKYSLFYLKIKKSKYFKTSQL